MIASPKRTAIAVGLIATTTGLLLGFWLKHQCVEPGIRWPQHFHKDCYSDIIELYGKRDATFNPPGKNIPFSAGGVAYRDNNFEYPALTGLMVSTANAFVPKHNVGHFLKINALFLSVFALIGSGCLCAVARKKWRIILLAVSPALISYAFHNWDLLPVGLMSIGIWAYARDHDGLAGAMLGLGAAAKVFPGLVLPALVFARVKQGRAVRTMIAQATAWFVIPNIVVLALAGKSGWWFPWKFQSERFPNPETFAYFLAHHASSWFPRSMFWNPPNGRTPPFAHTYQLLSLAVFAVASAILLYREYRRPGPFRPISASFGLIILFLITAKVYSPQYSIWLLPFFVLLEMPLWSYALFAVTDMLVLSLIWSYYTHTIDHSFTAWTLNWLEIGVYIRYAGLGIVLWQSRKVRELLPAEPVAPPASYETAALRGAATNASP